MELSRERMEQALRMLADAGPKHRSEDVAFKARQIIGTQYVTSSVLEFVRQIAESPTLDLTSYPCRGTVSPFVKNWFNWILETQK